MKIERNMCKVVREARGDGVHGGPRWKGGEGPCLHGVF